MIHLHFREIREVFFIRPWILRSLPYCQVQTKEEKPKQIVKKTTAEKNNIPVSNKGRGRRYGI